RLVNVASNALVSGQPSARWGNEHPNIVPYQAFELADRTVIVGAGNDAQYQRLCALLGIADADLLTLSNAERVARRATLIPLLAERLRTWSAEVLLVALKAEKIPCAPIL